MSTPHEEKPWYKHPHVWLLITFPVLAILGGMHMLYLAATSKDSLVSDNYYKEGNNINQRLQLEKAALAKGITAQVILGDNQQSIRILLNKKELGPIKLKIVHPTMNGLDQEITLSKQTGGMYIGNLKQPLQAGNWHVELSDDIKTWSLRKTWATQRNESVALP
nr:FixH family protein [uncultured Deefgea sp.]